MPGRINYPLLSEKCEILHHLFLSLKWSPKHSGVVVPICICHLFGSLWWFCSCYCFDFGVWFGFGRVFLSNDNSQLVMCLKSNRTLNLFATRKNTCKINGLDLLLQNTKLNINQNIPQLGRKKKKSYHHSTVRNY